MIPQHVATCRHNSTTTRWRDLFDDDEEIDLLFVPKRLCPNSRELPHHVSDAPMPYVAYHGCHGCHATPMLRPFPMPCRVVPLSYTHLLPCPISGPLPLAYLDETKHKAQATTLQYYVGPRVTSLLTITTRRAQMPASQPASTALGGCNMRLRTRTPQSHFHCSCTMPDELLTHRIPR